MKETPMPDAMNSSGEGQYLGTMSKFICFAAQKKMLQLEYKATIPRTLANDRGDSGTLSGSGELVSISLCSLSTLTVQKRAGSRCHSQSVTSATPKSPAYTSPGHPGAQEKKKVMV